MPGTASQSVALPEASGFRVPSRLPYVLALGLIGVAVVVLRSMGRVWWCSCAAPTPWIADIWSSHCSQHLLDAYTFSHISHGLLFFIAFGWLHAALPARWQARFTPGWWFFAAIALEVGWEVLENTPLVIERYRGQTASLNYNGDSIGNSIGDILSCAAGFLIAWRIGAWRAFALFVAFELLTLFWIRDNLTLNVVMLLHPIEAIKHWQTPASLR
ncbi:MAG: DUF2585 family protein [Phycisphaerales bacterium]|nr:DUF2585 family protein [Phycisphaerales bacterium]